MKTLIVAVILGTVIGWLLDNIVGPWAQAMIQEARLRRELAQQQQLRRILEGVCEDVTSQPVRCICEWFDHDTLIRNPQCKASDHGGVAEMNRRMLSYLHQRPTGRYKLKNFKE